MDGHMTAYDTVPDMLDCAQIPPGQPRREFGNPRRGETTAPASTRREPSFAARGTIAAVAGRQKWDRLLARERQLWVDSGGSIVVLRTAAIGALRSSIDVTRRSGFR